MVPPPFRLPILSSPAAHFRMGFAQMVPAKKQNSAPRHKFSAEEDQRLKDLVAELGESNWNEISARLGNRTPRQCRERFRNYLSPNISNDPWNNDDDERLRKLFKQYGPKWSLIATYFPNRSDVNVKNHWSQINNKNTREQNLQKEKQQLLKQIDIVIEQTKMIAQQQQSYRLKLPPQSNFVKTENDDLQTSFQLNENVNVSSPTEDSKENQILDWYNMDDTNQLSFFDDGNDYISF